MTRPLESYDRLIAANFSDEQARAILEAMASDLVTRTYLDARLQAMESRLEAKLASLETTLTWRLGSILGVTIVLVGLIDRFVR